MRSSTSSSSSAATTLWQALRLVAQEAGPTALGFALLIALGWACDRAWPFQEPVDVAEIVIEEQFARARAGSDAEILLLGDSSGLQGVDPDLLGRLLGRRVENLCTLGWVGPRGYARLLALAGGRRQPDTVVLFLHGTSLEMPERMFAATGYEERVLGDLRLPPPERPWRGARRWLAGIWHRATRLPLPGAYGRFFGGNEEVRRHLRERHGGLIDPNEFHPAADTRGFRFVLSPAVAGRLPALDRELARGGARVLVVVTPLPASCADTETVEGHASMAARLERELAGSQARCLATPVVLADSCFATQTHLNQAGREAFTRALAATLGAP